MLNIAGALPFSLAPAVAPLILDLGGAATASSSPWPGPARSPEPWPSFPSRGSADRLRWPDAPPGYQAARSRARADGSSPATAAGRPAADRDGEPRLVLVSAPAGFGKTTLLAQWLASDRAGARDARSRPPRRA